MVVRSLKRKRRNVSADSGNDRTHRNVDNNPPIIVVGESTDNDDGATEPTNRTGNASEYVIIDPTSTYSGDTGTGADTGADSSTDGRSRRKYTKRTRKADSETTKTLAQLLYSIHLMGSNMVDAEEFSITSEEAQTLAEATTRVSQLYDIAVMGEKTAAWLGLGFTVGTIYGPRFMSLRARRRDELKEKGIKKVQAIN